MPLLAADLETHAFIRSHSEEVVVELQVPPLRLEALWSGL
jgi:hypothetical protein